MSLLERDEPAGELKHGEVVLRESLPADQEATEPVVPTVRPLDDPATRLAANTSDERLLASTTDVRNDPANSDRGFAVGVVVALVQTQVARTTRTEQAADHDCVEHLGDKPLVVHVGPGDPHGQRHSSRIGQNVPFHAEFPPVGRVRPGVDPPFGALAMALSSEAKSHLMPRRLS